MIRSYQQMHCESLYLRIAPARISLLRFLLEGYEGLALLTTLDSGQGLVRLLVPRSRFQELIRFLAAVSGDLTTAAPELQSMGITLPPAT